MLHHIGIVVDSLAEALPLFQVWMHARPVGGIVEDHTQGARIQLCAIQPDTLLEIVEPIPGEENFLHRADGFHLCFTVPDLDAEMARLHELGAVVIKPAGPSQLFANQRISVLATHSGQLLELLEDKTLQVQ